MNFEIDNKIREISQALFFFAARLRSPCLSFDRLKFLFRPQRPPLLF
ncbi:hypothetical protein L905_20090 [Agrobacterium sp. TS43]|nr:hypothetical protein L906_17295 [Agrobacterium sp. TS45]KVK63536.1 hypothetical protein L905_20090 [Agrobacterium sp. TS43]KVK67756.1 hypothetical protein L907_16710 [Agrobacterium sp. C13]